MHPYHEDKLAESVAEEAIKMRMARYEKREAAANRFDERNKADERKRKLGSMTEAELMEQHRQERVVMSKLHDAAGYTDLQRHYSFNELDRKHLVDWRLYRLVHKEKKEAQLERKVPPSIFP
jgi:hypothetical protein